MTDRNMWRAIQHDHERNVIAQLLAPRCYDHSHLYAVRCEEPLNHGGMHAAKTDYGTVHWPDLGDVELTA